MIEVAEQARAERRIVAIDGRGREMIVAEGLSLSTVEAMVERFLNGLPGCILAVEQLARVDCRDHWMRYRIIFGKIASGA